MILRCIELDNLLMMLDVWPILIPHRLCLITHCLPGISQCMADPNESDEPETVEDDPPVSFTK